MLHTIRLLFLLLLTTTIITIIHGLPSTQLTRRATVISGPATASAVSIPFSAKYQVRWLDVENVNFGATFNLTFQSVETFAKRWQLRFRLADNRTQVDTVWGSWQVRMLQQGWIQLLPEQDLRMDVDNKVYFSFNGSWNTTGLAAGSVPSLAVSVMELQVSEPGDVRSPPVVYRLTNELQSLPLDTMLPVGPFGTFVRSQNNSSAPERLIANLSSMLTVSKANMAGSFVIVGIISAFLLMYSVATFKSVQYRRQFREQARVQDFTIEGKSASRKSSMAIAPMTPVALGGLASPQGYYMMAEHDFGGAGSLAEVYYQPSRHTLLEPGLEYRKSMMAAGIHVPESWSSPRPSMVLGAGRHSIDSKASGRHASVTGGQPVPPLPTSRHPSILPRPVPSPHTTLLINATPPVHPPPSALLNQHKSVQISRELPPVQPISPLAFVTPLPAPMVTFGAKTASRSSFESVAVSDRSSLQERAGMPRPEELFLGDEEEEDDDALWGTSLARKSSQIIRPVNHALITQQHARYQDTVISIDSNLVQPSTAMPYRGSDFGRGLFVDDLETATEQFPSVPNSGCASPLQSYFEEH